MIFFTLIAFAAVGIEDFHIGLLNQLFSTCGCSSNFSIVLFYAHEA